MSQTVRQHVWNSKVMNNNKGVTLIELLIVAAILLISAVFIINISSKYTTEKATDQTIEQVEKQKDQKEGKQRL